MTTNTIPNPEGNDMRTLSYYKDVNQLAQPLLYVRLKDGREIYLCDDYAEARSAMDEGAPFEAHAVQGMRPVPTILNPPYVAMIQIAGEPHETYTKIERIEGVAS